MIVIPQHAVDHVLGAGRNEARIAVNRLNDDPNWPSIVMLMSPAGMADFLKIIQVAIEHAPDPDSKEGWRSLGIKITSAIQGALSE